MTNNIKKKKKMMNLHIKEKTDSMIDHHIAIDHTMTEIPDITEDLIGTEEMIEEMTDQDMILTEEMIEEIIEEMTDQDMILIEEMIEEMTEEVAEIQEKTMNQMKIVNQKKITNQLKTVNQKKLTNQLKIVNQKKILNQTKNINQEKMIPT